MDAAGLAHASGLSSLLAGGGLDLRGWAQRLDVGVDPLAAGGEWLYVEGVFGEAPMKGDIVSVEENKAILRDGAKAFNNVEDRSGWFAIHDRSVIAEGLAEEPLDLEGLKEFYSGLWLAFPDLRITIEDMVGEDDRVAWRLTVDGTHESEFRGIPATGIRVQFSAQYFFRFRNGKIVERWTNFDRHPVLTQLGAKPVVVPA